MSVEYIAGLFDGEGTISIRTRKNRKDVTFEIKITTTANEISSLLEDTGLKHRAEENHSKTMRVFYLTKMNDILNFLSLLHPHLRIKKAQAKAMIDLIKSRLQHPKARYTDNEIKLINFIRGRNWVAKKYPNVPYP